MKNSKSIKLLTILLSSLLITACKMDANPFDDLKAMFVISDLDDVNTSHYRNLHEGKVVEYRWATMLPAYMSLRTDFTIQSHLLKYIAIFYPKVYKKVSDDEFALNKVSATYKAQMQKQINAATESVIYEAKIKVYLGKYNFEEGYFPVSNISSTDFGDRLFLQTNITKNRYELKRMTPYPSEFHLSLSSEKMPKKIFMLQSKAEKLLSRNEDRAISGRIKFNIIGLEHNDKNKDLRSFNNKQFNLFVGDVISVRLIY